MHFISPGGDNTDGWDSELGEWFPVDPWEDPSCPPEA